jgi:predicted patatin/cPLA2 family phospholipase
LKKALLIEGGGMRSVHSAGALTAFSDLGFSHDYFDFVFGSSAGACNSAYFLSGQTDMFWDMWSDTLLSKDFINFTNMLRPNKPILDIDFIINEIMVKRHPLDIKKIINSRTRFYVPVTNCHTGKIEYFINDKEESFLEVIKASSAIPVLYNRTVMLNGSEYIDGSVNDSIPIKRAVEMGATEIYVILTRHDGYRKNNTLIDNLVGSLLNQYPKIREALMNRHINYNECLDFLESLVDELNITIIRPAYDLGITRATTDPKEIKTSFRIGYYDAKRILKGKNISWLKELDESQSRQSFPATDMPA